MGLLALVAAAGKRGVSRQRVVGVFWGEAGEEQARHTLSQNLYTLRRETGRDWIVAAPELRLHPAVASDVGEFQEALAADDLPRVAALYSGEFLEGFYLAGVPEFERWVEEERARLRAAALRALEVLAARADEARRHHEAIGWWRRLADLDPLGARYAAGLMRALAAAGDQASALAHLKSHRDLVKRELDADPDPAILALAASFRHAAVAAAPDSRRAAAAPAPPGPDTPPAGIAEPGSAPPRHIRALVAAVVAVAALAAAAWQLVGRDPAPPQPFLAVGVIRTADSTALGGVLRDMLATNLGSIQGLQVVANSRLLELMTPRGADTLPGATADAARRAGATDIIEGELVSGAGDLRLTLRRVALASGLVRQGYTVHAPDAARLMDSATAAIARDLRAGSPSGEMATIRTSSPAAYALYEEGLRALYGGEPEDAYRLMRAALERDSSFAMAAYYGWVASRGIVPGLEGDRDLRRLAKSLAPRTIERERLLIDGFVAGQTAAVAKAIAIAETLSIRYPGDPDGQNLLGFTYVSGGNWSGAVAAFERAIEIDSVAGATSGSFCRVCLALGGMTNAFVGWDSLAAAERTARRLIALRPGERAAWANLAEPLLRQGRRREAVAALQRHDALARSGDWSRGVIQRDMIRQGQFEELEPQLLANLADPAPEMQGGARWLMLISLRNQGRYREAMALARDGVLPGSQAGSTRAIPERLHQAILLMETGRPGEAAVRFREMAAASQADSIVSGLGARHTAWRLTLAGTALAAAGDTASVRRIADSVERIGRESNYGRDPRLHHFLRGLILQRGGRHAEAVEAFQRATHTLSDGYSRINWELARSLMALGRPDEAISALRPALRGGVDGSNTYLTHTELHEALAQAFELAGRFDSTAVHYRAVERAWRHADPQFSTRYAKARAGAGVQH